MELMNRNMTKHFSKSYTYKRRYQLWMLSNTAIQTSW